jgi:diacylglycerol kinase family enzyme
VTGGAALLASFAFPEASLRILVVVNPFASSVTARSTVVIHKALSADHEVTLVETNRRGQATRYAHDAAAKRFDAVVALGGDGTLNEVANGVVGTRTALAPLPGGSTNVFARTIGYPNDPIEATGVLLSSLACRRPQQVGVGRVNGRAFLFHTGVGFDAAVVASVEKRSDLKRWAGHPLFIWSGLSTWLRGFDRKTPHFTVMLDDGSVIEGGYFAAVLNANPYTYLGNTALDISDAATLDRGLVVVVFRSLSPQVVVPAIVSALRGKGIPDGRHITVRTDVTGLKLTAVAPEPWQVDGDHMGDAAHLEFIHDPDGLALVMP